jgi:hypothetical protein
MVCKGSHGRLRDKFKTAAASLAEDAGSGLSQLLSPEIVNQAAATEGIKFRDCLFTPVVTLWIFLGQVLNPDGSCRAAVAKLLAFLAAQGVQTPTGEDCVSPDTGPYCKARKRLPEGLVSRLAKDAGKQLHDRHPAGTLLGGRKVKVVDGTTCSMPDTPANQKQWPQPPTQKPGLGFPLARLVGLISLNSAAWLDVAMGPYQGKQTGETALFRTMLDGLEKGDVLLADRYFASYMMIALLLARGVDSLFRQHQERKIDFRSGRRLGHDDHVITLERPAQRPEWMTEAEYEQIPETMEVREVRLKIEQRGFRVKTMVLVTTLLDAELYSKQEIAKAFRCRWHAELDIRTIKQTMNMSVLRCKTPELVRKEIWMHVLAYNLVRTTMAEAAKKAGIEPREVSFAAAVQTINAFAPMLEMADEADRERLFEVMLRTIANHRVGDRPDRYEPRAVKRRAKPIALLKIPRAEAKKRMAKSGGAKS